MATAAIITLIIILIAIILFASEVISIDLVAILILVALVLTGVITPEEGVAGFSNKATLTVAFMFILSAALLKTGALQFVAQGLAKTFKKNFTLGMTFMMLLIAFISAFVNNTPVVAVFIPVIIQVAKASGVSPSKMLIPLSFASIFGGMCTLIGTSTNILVSGIAMREGLPEFSMFQMLPVGIILLVVGIIYMVFIGNKLLPNRKFEDNLSTKFGLHEYLAEIELLKGAPSVGKEIMNSPLVNELKIFILEVKRENISFALPPGDFILQEKDILKIRCDVEKIKTLKDKQYIQLKTPTEQSTNKELGSSSLIEIVITSNSEFDGLKLKQIDFRGRFRSIPLAVKHREEIVHENLLDLKIRRGDIILLETKNHFIDEFKKIEKNQDAPFVLLSEHKVEEFDRIGFFKVIAVISAVIFLATFNVVDIMIGTIAGVAILALTNTISMKEAYEAVNWKIVFLLAGALSLGTAMKNSGLDQMMANLIVNQLGLLGPVAVVSGLYLATALLTETMSNNAAAALMAPIAIVTASTLGVSATPLLMAVMFAASASFVTPIGYQTNAMVYSAGQYRFLDFTKAGIWLSLLFWILASILIPIFFKF